jgi:hypothetical protein
LFFQATSAEENPDGCIHITNKQHVSRPVCLEFKRDWCSALAANSLAGKEFQMNSVYAMQRANGDWFALKDGDSLRVPVFQSSSHAMTARSRDSGMECFRPMILTAGAIDGLMTGAGNVCFWLVQNPSIKLSHGQPLDQAQLESLMRNQLVAAKNEEPR